MDLDKIFKYRRDFKGEIVCSWGEFVQFEIYPRPVYNVRSLNDSDHFDMDIRTRNFDFWFNINYSENTNKVFEPPDFIKQFLLGGGVSYKCVPKNIVERLINYINELYAASRDWGDGE